MNEILIKNWNATVKPGDIVFHLGDVALGPWSEWDAVLKRLNGAKVLVVGNHDRVFKGMSEAQQARFAEHYRRWFDGGIVDNYEGFELWNGSEVNLSHFPYDGDSHDGDRYTEYRLKDTGMPLVHGHTHAEYAKDGDAARVSYSVGGTLQIHVGADAWDYRPVPESQVIALIDKHS